MQRSENCKKKFSKARGQYKNELDDVKAKINKKKN